MADAVTPTQPEKPTPAPTDTPVARVPTVQTSASALPPVMEIEPLLGLAMFQQTASLSVPLHAALKAWMRLNHHDPDGHYSPKEWREYMRQTLAHSG